MKATPHFGSKERSNTFTSQSQSGQSTHASPAPVTKNPKLCVIENCENRAKERQILCLIHIMTERHRKAAEVAAAVLKSINSRPNRGFDKTKIYPANAETRKLMSEKSDRSPVAKKRRISYDTPTIRDASPKNKRLPARPPSFAYEARMNENESESCVRIGGSVPRVKEPTSSTTNAISSKVPPTRSLSAQSANNAPSANTEVSSISSR